MCLFPARVALCRFFVGIPFLCTCAASYMALAINGGYVLIVRASSFSWVCGRTADMDTSLISVTGSSNIILNIRSLQNCRHDMAHLLGSPLHCNVSTAPPRFNQSYGEDHVINSKRGISFYDINLGIAELAPQFTLERGTPNTSTPCIRCIFDFIFLSFPYRHTLLWPPEEKAPLRQSAKTPSPISFSRPEQEWKSHAESFLTLTTVRSSNSTLRSDPPKAATEGQGWRSPQGASCGTDCGKGGFVLARGAGYLRLRAGLFCGFGGIIPGRGGGG